MSVEILTGDMFASGADALVCPVNCIGVMGAGLAKVFAKRYPGACGRYGHRCRVDGLFPGDVFEVGDPLDGAGPGPRAMILFAATKLHWRNPSKLEWVRQCASGIVASCVASCEVFPAVCRSVAIPAIGAGLGELAWDDVRPILVRAAEVIEAAGVKVFLYGPKETRR